VRRQIRVEFGIQNRFGGATGRSMNLIKTIDVLGEERAMINDAILALEKVRTVQRHPGRSAAWLRELAALKRRVRLAVKTDITTLFRPEVERSCQSHTGAAACAGQSKLRRSHPSKWK
jgi:hypothetical protein